MGGFSLRFFQRLFLSGSGGDMSGCGCGGSFCSPSVSHGSRGSLGFFFSLPFLYLPFLCGVNAISCHDANRVFSFLIVSHNDILQTYVRMQGSINQDVPTPLLTYAVFLVILLCIRPFPATAHPVHTLPSPRPHLTPSFTFWF